ncbi:hypothetical protein D3C84_761130 [compost metagenome]
MANGDGQGIGGIDLRLADQFQQVHHHHLHLLLVRRPGSDDRLLDLGRAVLGDLQVFLGASNDCRTPGLPQLQGRVGVARHENLFDAHGHRAVGLDDLAHAAINDLQALVQFTRPGADATRRDVHAAAPGIANHTVAGDARTRVDTKD